MNSEASGYPPGHVEVRYDEPPRRQSGAGGNPSRRQSGAGGNDQSRRPSQTGQVQSRRGSYTGGQAGPVSFPVLPPSSGSQRPSQAGDATLPIPPDLPPIRTSKRPTADGAVTIKVFGEGNSIADRRSTMDGAHEDIWQQAADASMVRTGKNKLGPTDGKIPMDEPEPAAKTPVFNTQPYFGGDVEAQQSAPDINGTGSLLGYSFKRQRAINWVGWIFFLYYIGAFLFYLYVRIAKTLDLGIFTFYGIILLVVECMGATTVIIYGINLLFTPVHEPFIDDDRQPGTPKVKLPYHIRVIVACYKEDLDCIKRTVKAAYAATLPYGCKRTIYLCDDGKDPEKRAWMKSKGPDFVYISGRKRAKGEMNGKSGNVNNICSQLYPDRLAIPGNEVLCIFDADQMAKKNFFLKTIPLLDGGDDVAMVLSPQCFHNMNLHTDIFNHSNIHFWEYMQPGYDAIGFISCTGTNFLIRANAFGMVGWSPTYTLTEDFALGMELKKEGFHCRYVQEYIAVGEAPHEVRNCFQQRSRWTKGHFQIMFNPKVCPLLQSKLNIFWRLMYAQGCWSYVVGGLSTPFFIALPVITIWIGVFPIVITRELALAMTIVGVANYLVLYYVRSWRQASKNLLLAVQPFCRISWEYISPTFWQDLDAEDEDVLCKAYWKAAWRALYTRVFACCASITFKATAKGKGKLKNSAFRDLWFHFILDFLLFLSIGVAVWQLIAGAAVISPLLISVLWAVYAAIPPTLLLYYATIGPGYVFQVLCKFFMFASFAAAAAAIGLMWAIKNYNTKNFSGGQLFANKDIGVLFRYIRRGFSYVG